MKTLKLHPHADSSTPVVTIPLRKRKKWPLVILIIIVLATITTTLLLILPNKVSSTPTITKTYTVAKGDLKVSVSATGKLEPFKIMSVRPDPTMPSRRIQSVLVHNGDFVTKNQILARIDASGLNLDCDSALANFQAAKSNLEAMIGSEQSNTLIQAESAREQARITLEQAENAVIRNKPVFEKGLITESAWADLNTNARLARAKLNSAESSWKSANAGTAAAEIEAQKAAVALAQSNLRKAQLILDSTLVRAPVDGTITEVLQVEGDLASSATVMFTISDISSMVVRAYIDEVDIRTVAIGQNAEVSVDGYPDMTFSGKITQVDRRSTIISNVTMFTALIQLPNTDGRLMWGMSATANVITNDLKNIVLVPSASIRTSTDRTQVAILENDKTWLWDIRAGVSDGSFTQVLSGLSEGDIILASAPRNTIPTSTKSKTEQRMNQGGLFGGAGGPPPGGFR